MRDKVFFPVALLLALAMVLIAVWPGVGRLPSGPVAGDGANYERITVDGAYLNKIMAGGDAITELVRDKSGKYLLYIRSDAETLGPDPEEGPHFRLASDLEQQFSGMRIRVTVRMRPADTQGAMQAKLNYSTGRSGDSGWQMFDLSPDFGDFSFEYNVPVRSGEQGYDYLGIRPVVPTKQRAILVERVTFERLGPAGTES